MYGSSPVEPPGSNSATTTSRNSNGFGVRSALRPSVPQANASRGGRRGGRSRGTLRPSAENRSEPRCRARSAIRCSDAMVAPGLATLELAEEALAQPGAGGDVAEGEPAGHAKRPRAVARRRPAMRIWGARSATAQVSLHSYCKTLQCAPSLWRGAPVSTEGLGRERGVARVDAATPELRGDELRDAVSTRSATSGASTRTSGTCCAAPSSRRRPRRSPTRARARRPSPRRRSGSREERAPCTRALREIDVDVEPVARLRGVGRGSAGPRGASAPTGGPTTDAPPVRSRTSQQPWRDGQRARRARRRGRRGGPPPRRRRGRSSSVPVARR